MGWATLWAIYAQTYLVTLASTYPSYLVMLRNIHRKASRFFCLAREMQIKTGGPLFFVSFASLIYARGKAGLRPRICVKKDNWIFNILANTAAAGNAHLVALFDCYHFLLDA
jgi:hypothetical protein